MSFKIAINGSTRDGRFLAFLVLVTFVVHPLAYIAGADTSLSVYTTFAAYLLLLGYSIASGKWLVRRYEMILICISSIGCIAGAASGIQAFGDSGFGSAVGYLLGLLSILSFAGRLNRADIILLLYTIFLFGLAAALYAFLFQTTQWMNVLRGNLAGSNSWQYYSFFGQRNRFAACLYLSSVCGSSMFFLTRRKSFIIAVAFLTVQIAITNSRTALIATLLSILAVVCLGSKNRVLVGISITGAAILVVSLFSEALSAQLSSFFTHYGGFDSASARTDMWTYGIGELANRGLWLFGFGTGTQNIALTPVFGVSSFHNMYVELLFEGGVVKVGSYLILILSSLLIAKNNTAFAKEGMFKLLYLPLLISWLAFSVFEAGATPFSTTFYSFVLGVLLFVLPRCYEVNVSAEKMATRTILPATKHGLEGRKTESVVLFHAQTK